MRDSTHHVSGPRADGAAASAAPPHLPPRPRPLTARRGPAAGPSGRPPTPRRNLYRVPPALGPLYHHQHSTPLSPRPNPRPSAPQAPARPSSVAAKRRSTRGPASAAARAHTIAAELSPRCVSGRARARALPPRLFGGKGRRRRRPAHAALRAALLYPGPSPGLNFKSKQHPVQDSTRFETPHGLVRFKRGPAPFLPARPACPTAPLACRSWRHSWWIS